MELGYMTIATKYKSNKIVIIDEPILTTQYLSLNGNDIQQEIKTLRFDIDSEIVSNKLKEYQCENNVIITYRNISFVGNMLYVGSDNKISMTVHSVNYNTK